MADEASILNGFYRNIPIAINAASLDGGRKTAIKQFPSRDTQLVEDLGLQPRKYGLEIIISDKAQQDYFAYRNRLLQALESSRPAELIHPLYGRIDNVVAVSYSLNETFTAFGDATVSVNFEVTNNLGIPQSSGNVITQISTSNNVVQSAISIDITDNFKVTPGFAGNFESATNKVDGIIESAQKATAFIGEATQDLNEFNDRLQKISSGVNGLVIEPPALAVAIIDLFDSVNGLYSSSDATFDTFAGFFGFGDDDDLITQDTAGRIERLLNNQVLNGAVASSSLAYAYLAISRIDFDTTLQIDTLTEQLDDQYLAVMQSGSSQDVKDAITDMRVKVLQALDDVRVNVSQIISVQTNPTTSRLLSFNYYGDDSLGAAIAELNGFSDVSFVDGDVKVLTA